MELFSPWVVWGYVRHWANVIQFRARISPAVVFYMAPRDKYMYLGSCYNAINFLPNPQQMHFRESCGVSSMGSYIYISVYIYIYIYISSIAAVIYALSLDTADTGPPYNGTRHSYQPRTCFFMELADWPKLHYMFKACCAKTRQRPVRGCCALHLLFINIYSWCCCSYRKQMRD